MIKKCIDCNNEFNSKGRSIYCGSLKFKTGCSIKNRILNRRVYIKKFKKNNPNYFTDKARLKKFNISKDMYENMKKIQNNLCEICNMENINRQLSIDHNHKTGKIRGLLCDYCNVSLGLLREDKNVLLNMIRYIEKYEVQ